jgi:DNA-directed RNA polymerase specialized sigma24 family protein
VSEIEWEQLRTSLVKHFPEDVVQDVLLRLFRRLSKGTKVPDPLRYCRRAATRLMTDGYRRQEHEREAIATLAALKIQFNNSSAQEELRARARRFRRNKKKKTKAA